MTKGQGIYEWWCSASQRRPERGVMQVLNDENEHHAVETGCAGGARQVPVGGQAGTCGVDSSRGRSWGLALATGLHCSTITKTVTKTHGWRAEYVRYITYGRISRFATPKYVRYITRVCNGKRHLCPRQPELRPTHPIRNTMNAQRS